MPDESDAALNQDYLRQRPEFQQVALTPPQLINLNAAGNATTRLLATTWNRYGGLLLSLSDALGFDPGVAAAVLAIESGGRGFAADSRMIIRLEIHQFLRQWGPEHREQFQVHFSFDPVKPWKNQQWRPAPNQAWHVVHGSQDQEWTAFDFARSLNDRAAKLSISMGLPQVMGFNHARLGYDSVEAMFAAFAAGERNQLLGFFDFCCGPRADPRCLPALRAKDFEVVAEIYNGSGNVAQYSSLLYNAFEAFQQLNAL